MKCEYCELLERKEDLLFEDDTLVVALKDSIITPGQITIFPKQHYTIMELVPTDVLEKCGRIAKSVSIAVFDALESQGTNVLIRNGLGAGQNTPHFSMEIIPRRGNDGLHFEWKTKQLMEDEMDIVFAQLTEELSKPKEELKPKEKPEKAVLKESKKGTSEEENYLLKSLRRIP